MVLIRVLSLLLLFVGVWPAGMAIAADVQALGCSQPAVQSAVNAARDGDVVAVPAGLCTWTATVTITAGITLKGAGIDQTIVIDDAASDPIVMNTAAGKSYRISGFTFRRGTALKKGSDPRIIHIVGDSTSFRVDHNKFDHTQLDKPHTRAIHTQGSVLGVIDHNTIISSGGLHGTIWVQHPRWGGPTNQYGDGSWADDSHWGTDKFVFIEDNTFVAPDGKHMFATDADAGGRFVFRYNQLTNANVSNHGTESSGRLRGGRAFEIYGNAATHTPNWAVFLRLRSGAALIYDNVVSGFNTFTALTNYRSTQNFGTWKSCDGSFPFDVNDGVVYDSGTLNGSATANDLTDTTKNWSPLLWSAGGFSVRNVTKGNGGYATSNTSNTISVVQQAMAPTARFDPGDQYQILRATLCMDAVGSGKGDLLSGHDPAPKAWPNQVRDPVFAWNNTHNAGKGDAVLRSDFKNPHIVEGRDFFNNTPKPGYIPFVYPHPLVSNGIKSLTAPTNLRVR